MKNRILESNFSKYFDFDLKPSQQRAFSLLQLFALNPNSKVFILNGYAGTGKTTLMGGFIKWLDEKDIIFSLLASTGRAAKILSDKTKSEARTVHSHIYTFNDLDDDLEKMSSLQEELKVDDKGQISLLFDLKIIESGSEKIYIVDESSMISDTIEKSGSFAKFGSGELLKDLFKYDKIGKFIFVGDPCQLPPIGQNISPALSREYIHNQYNITVEEFELKEIIRQSSKSGIIDASVKVRDLYQNNPPVKFASFPLKNHPDIEIHSSHVSLLNSYIAQIKENGFEHSTLISQTNRHCSDLNKIIRSSREKQSTQLEPGDILMVTQNNYLTTLVNGDVVEVLQTGQKEYRCGLSFVKVHVRELSSGETYSVLLIEDILYSMSTNLNNKQHKDLMIDYYYRMKSNGISQKDKAFKDRMLTDPYLNGLKAVYGYALTCHKSQGGEWNEVFLYLDNKIHGIPKPGIYQWLYTAITRAKTRLHIVNDWFIK
ncbi:MAG: AAA family ATPase [Candidatus Delongbacteria bacterium]|nr:AAA family ATPase [Candidatus Delongbacteria bacterium]